MANMLLKRIKDWETSINSFRTGDVIPVDGPDGTAKMNKDDLLRETAENAAESGLVVVPEQREADKESVAKGYTKTTSSDYISYTGIPANGTNTWYVGGGAKHIAVPLIAGQTISVTPSTNTNYVFCDSSYVAGNKTKDATLEVSSRNLFRHNIAANTKTTFVANSDDAYLILVVVTGAGKSVSIDIEIYNELSVSELLGNGLKDCNIGMRTLSQSDYMEYSGSISSSTNTFYFDGNKGKHIDIRLVPNCVYVVKSNRIGRLSVGGSLYLEGDKYTGDPLNLATERSNTLVNANYPISIVTGDDDKYLTLNTIDGAGNSITWTIECYFVAKKKIAASTKRSSSDFVKQTGMPANGTNTWYVGGGAKHIAVPVSKGEVVSIKPNANTNYVFVTSRYTEGDQTNGSTLYVSSRNKTRNTIIGGQSLTFTANSDDAYLILVVVNGGGVSISIDIEYKVSGDYAEDFEISPLFKIKYGTWNIGHFSMGTDTITTITPEQKEEKQLAYRNFLNSLNLDVLGVCEDDPIFCKDGTRSDVAVYSLFKFLTEGTKYGYNCNSYYHNLGEPINDEMVFFPASSQVRYLHEVEFVVNGKKVVFAETHLELTSVDRATEINAIINRYSDYDYVVISGDFNVADELTELQPFVDAGYTLALMGYVGAIPTYSNINPHLCIDNVIVKGFAVSNVAVHDTTDLSDHKLVSCDLTMV